MIEYFKSRVGNAYGEIHNDIFFLTTNDNRGDVLDVDFFINEIHKKAISCRYDLETLLKKHTINFKYNENYNVLCFFDRQNAKRAAKILNLC